MEIFYSLPIEKLFKFAITVNYKVFFSLFFIENAQVMSVCKLDNNGIYNLPTSISETGDVSMPTNLDEQSIGEPVPGHDHDFTVNQEAAGIKFQLVEQGTKRGKARLIDNLGYTYNLHHRRSYATYWQCAVRSKGNPCRASVTERDGTFQPGKNGHNHPAEAGTAVAAKIVTRVKEKAAQEKFRSAAAIVDEVSVLTLRLEHFLCKLFEN